jgi:hypothetical protein
MQRWPALGFPARKKESSEMTATQLAFHIVSRGKAINFTQERVQQIRNLVERGKTRDEIAEIIGITSEALQIACSRLGISLRRRTNLPSPLYRKESPIRPRPYGEGMTSQPPKVAQRASVGKPAEEGKAREARWHGTLSESASAVLVIRTRYRSKERLTGLPLDQAMLEQLVWEAEIRGIKINELVAKLIFAAMNIDPFQMVGDLAPDGGKPRAPSAPCRDLRAGYGGQ